MKKIVNLLISLVVFLIAISIANATGNSLVVEAVLIAFIIQWAAFIPAYAFQTEKFYDLTGTLTYLTVTWYTLYMSSEKFTNLNGASIAIVLFISLWAIRLGSFLFSRIHKDGEDKRFRTIKPSATQFFMTWTLQGLWVSLCSMCALTAISSESGVVVNAFYYLGVGLFIYGFYTEVKAYNEKSKFRSVPENCKIVLKQNISTGLKPRKNNIELDGIRKAMVKDCVALVDFAYWLETSFGNDSIDELKAMQKLKECREAQEDFYGESFNTIAGYEGNGAIIHYKATKKTNRKLKKGDIYLVDSGGQYEFGTTDVTRTISLRNSNIRIKNIF